MTRLPALWQRNVIGAIVVAAAALGILVAIDLGPQWATYRGTVIAGTCRARWPKRYGGRSDVEGGVDTAPESQPVELRPAAARRHRVDRRHARPLRAATRRSSASVSSPTVHGGGRTKASAAFIRSGCRRGHQHVQQSRPASIRLLAPERCGADGDGRPARRPDHGADAVVVSLVSCARTCSRQYATVDAIRHTRKRFDDHV